MRRRRGNGPSRRRYATTGTTLGNKASFTVAGRGYQPPCRPERRPAASSLPSSPHCTRVRRSTEHALPNGRRGGRYSAVLRISKLRRMLGLLCDAASAEKRAESPALAVDNTSVTSSLVSRSGTSDSTSEDSRLAALLARGCSRPPWSDSRFLENFRCDGTSKTGRLDFSPPHT